MDWAVLEAPYYDRTKYARSSVRGMVWSGLVWSGKLACKSYRTGTVLGGRCATDGVGGARSMSMA